MNRREVPRIGMISYGEDRLREGGFVTLPLNESFTIDPTRLRPHYHDFFQVSLLLGDGSLMHDFRESEASGATLFFLSPGQVHTIVPRPRMSGTIVSFTREFLEEGVEDGFLMNLPFFFTTEQAPWLRLADDRLPWVEGVFRELQEEYDAAPQGFAEVARCLLRVLFVKVARWYGVESPVMARGRQAVLVRRFRQELEAHHHEWQTLDHYAKALGVTTNHLHDAVRVETGQSAGEHLRERRLLDAKRQLLHSTMSVSEVGYGLGFADPSYFSRFFKRSEGMSPAEFRKKIREKYQKDHG
ncbi:MAG: helix-turn-helix domain-containing protein [Akkermansiaceae bacterium]|nr:helix-turn-helix domain-containing protein [Akkermansiaceae bacterium]